MGDALSVAASIIGILAAAGKVAETLGPVVSAFKDTTNTATAIYAEVNSSRTILTSLQALLNDLENSPERRRQLIQVDQLVAVLTDGVLIFNELEPLVLQLGNDTERWRTRIQWTIKKDKLNSFVSRMQLFKGSINVMLSILHCRSDLEAIRRQHELGQLVSILLESHVALCSSLGIPGSDEGDSERYSSTNYRSSATSIASRIHFFAFEGDLEGTWPYRKARRSTADASFRSSVALSHAWSALSGVSLSDISAISVVALPLTPSDLINGHHYMEHVETELAGGPSSEDQIESVTQSVLDVLQDQDSVGSQAPAQSSLGHGTDENTSGKTVWPDTIEASARKNNCRDYRIMLLVGKGVDKSKFQQHLMWERKKLHSADGRRNVVQRRESITGGLSLRIDVFYRDRADITLVSREYVGHEGFVVAYNVSSRASFDEAAILLRNVSDAEGTFGSPPMVLVGIQGANKEERQVTFAEAQALAQIRRCPVFEVSIERDLNIRSVFSALIKGLRRYDSYRLLDVMQALRAFSPELATGTSQNLQPS